jgi:hypothetical protein
LNQRQLSFFYRGILLLLAGSFLVALLSTIDQPWARYGGAIGGAVLFLGGAAFIISVTLQGFIQFLNAPTPHEPVPEDLYLDRWIYIARLAIAPSVLLAAIFVTVLLFVEAPQQCPNWHLPDRHSSPSLWLPFFMSTVPLLVALTVVGIRWRWIVRKAIESVDYPTTVPIPYTLVATVLFGCVMAQFPWALLVSRCWSST